MEIKNSISSQSEVLYGLHAVPGCAEYRPPGAEPYRVFLSEKTIKSMDSSFSGKPLYVGHVDDVNLNEADGWVIESFFLPCDGKTWCKFMAVSDRAKEAIRNGRKLSNAYIPKSFGGAGTWNGIDYQKEILSAEYEHLALVPDPRYAESVILTPAQFKDYVSKKELELSKVANSANEIPEDKGENMAFWKKTKVENSIDLESTMVDLPKSKTQADLKTIINEVDDYRLEMKLPKMANDEDEVEVGEGEAKKKMKVGEMKNAYCQMMSDKMEAEKKNDAASEEKMSPEEEKKKEMKANADAEKEERMAPELEKQAEMKGGDGVSGKDKAKNAEDAQKLEKEEAEKSKLKNEKEEKARKLFNELNNAHLVPLNEEKTPDLSFDRMARGLNRYGSNK